MAKKKAAKKAGKPAASVDPFVAAELAGVIYQARLQNRASKLNIPEEEVFSDVIELWRRVMDTLSRG
jgi:hypothetical protein